MRYRLQITWMDPVHATGEPVTKEFDSHEDIVTYLDTLFADLRKSYDDIVFNCHSDPDTDRELHVDFKRRGVVTHHLHAFPV